MTEAHGPDSGIGAEGLALGGDAGDDRLQPMLLHEGQMLGKALVAGDAVSGAADGPDHDQARYRLRIGNGKGQHRAAAHAPAHDVRAGDAEMVQQALALRGIVGPGHALDPAAGPAALPPVEGDAGIGPRQMVEQPDLGVDALGAPLLRSRIEAAGRVH